MLKECKKRKRELPRWGTSLYQDSAGVRHVHERSRRRRLSAIVTMPNKPSVEGKYETRLEAVRQPQPPASLPLPLARGAALPAPALVPTPPASAPAPPLPVGAAPAPSAPPLAVAPPVLALIPPVAIEPAPPALAAPPLPAPADPTPPPTGSGVQLSAVVTAPLLYAPMSGAVPERMPVLKHLATPPFIVT